MSIPHSAVFFCEASIEWVVFLSNTAKDSDPSHILKIFYPTSFIRGTIGLQRR